MTNIKPKKPKVVTVKAWAVIRIDTRNVKNPREPEIEKADIDSDCGCASTSSLGIYLNEYEASITSYGWKDIKQIKVPITISYVEPQ